MADEQDENTKGAGTLGNSAAGAAAQGQDPAAKQFLLQKIYVKDLSFESPKSPQVFTSKAPAQTELNIRSGNESIDEQNVEVTLTITVESKAEEQTVFLIEIVQAGVFMIAGYTAEERSALLGSFCPNTLYPFAREVISDVATKGGFPQLLLQPINFDALYTQALQERAAQAAGGAPADLTVPQNPAPDSSGGGGTH